MAKQHGKSTVVIIAGTDISAYCDKCEFGRTGDKHDVTTFGKNAHVYGGGLLDGTIALEGLYETITVTGSPRLIVKPLVGTVVSLVHRPEGTGTGKPQDTVNVHVDDYVESSPVADYVRWTAALQMSDDMTTAQQ